MDLQPLFAAPVLEQTYLDRDYSGFGNDVWIVRTRDERVVVRASARSGTGGAFWCGVERLFGIDSNDLGRAAVVSDVVNRAGHFRAPRVLRSGSIGGRACIVTEFLRGDHADSFDDLPPAAAESFGRIVARAHADPAPMCGAPAGASYPAEEFHRRAAETIDWAGATFRAGESSDAAIVDAQARELRALPSGRAALILFDTGGSQYLWDGDGPVAVVDTEVFVYAPPELELVVLESDNGPLFCEAFRRGYESVAPLPDLRAVRPAYRSLIALLEVNGRMSLDRAIDAPTYF